MKRIITILLLSLFSAGLFSQENIAIVYNGRTAVNRETGKYIIKQSKKLGLDYKYTVTEVDRIKDINQYKSVIILNTSVKSEELHPGIEGFVSNTKDKTPLILLTFISGSKGLEAKLLKGDDAIGGVDGVTSASIYKGQQNTDFEWFDILVELLK